MQPWPEVWAAVHTYLALSLKSLDSRAESRSNARRGTPGTFFFLVLETGACWDNQGNPGAS